MLFKRNLKTLAKMKDFDIDDGDRAMDRLQHCFMEDETVVRDVSFFVGVVYDFDEGLYEESVY